MTVCKKAVFSLLISAFLVAGIVIFFGRIQSMEIPTLALSEKTAMTVSVFFTIFITIFLFFNIRQCPVTVFHSRLKDSQISFIELMFERSGEIDWNRWSKDYMLWRDGICREIKNGLDKDLNGAAEKIDDSFIDMSWDDMLLFFRNSETADSEVLEFEDITEKQTGGLLAAATSLLSKKSASADIIFERNGIHFINNEFINNNSNPGGKLDGNFVKLVESVVSKS